jgi:hypothetical protein
MSAFTEPTSALLRQAKSPVTFASYGNFEILFSPSSNTMIPSAELGR